MKFIVTILLSIILLTPIGAATVSDSIYVDSVMSDFPVGFCLLTHDSMQYVAYYKPNHSMMVGQRKIDSRSWVKKELNQVIDFDSHKYITMAIDKDGYIHLCGNMHVSKLVYYRSSEPNDITTLEPINEMIGKDEDSITYPVFIKGAENTLIFHYRNGHSGEGDEIFNRYETATKEWTRLLDTPLFDGQGVMNAYLDGPKLMTDDYYHIVWVWRDSYLCETNHTLSYARSKDMVNWEDAFGNRVDLPMTIEKKNLWVDSVKVREGILNGCYKLGLDKQSRPVIDYHKFDANGNTQLYVARPRTNGSWNIKQVSHWNYRWWFQGGGSINREIRLGVPTLYNEEYLKITYNHAKYGKGYYLLDAETLEVVDSVRTGNSDLTYTENSTIMRTPAASFLKKSIVTQPDIETRTSSEGIYSLKWMTYPSNRDTIRSGITYDASPLFVIQRGGTLLYEEKAMSWDFTNTVLLNDALDHVKADTANYKRLSFEKYQSKYNIDVHSPKELLANGVVIPLTEGLKFGNVVTDKRVIQLSRTSFKLNGNAMVVFIDGVKKGQVLTVDWSPGSNNVKRGLKINSNLTNIDGFGETYSTRTICTATASDDGTISFMSNGGVFLYKINVDVTDKVDFAAVPSGSVNKKTYNLFGQQVSDSFKGIIIINRNKIIKR